MPQHPSYTQAHGGVAGACATILKAAFDGATPWSALGDGSVKIASGDGLELYDYAGADADRITVNGEIEKLASNIALARNFAGVHTCTSGALILAFLAGPAIAQVKPQSPATDAQAILAPIFSGFRSPKWDQRANAFRALLRLGSNETEFAPRPLHLALARFGHEANQIHLALIALLAREDDAANNAPRGYWSEAYMNYYGDLIAVVGTLGDPRSIDALVGAVETGGDATEPLAAFGSEAIPALLARMRDGDMLARFACLEVLVAMLEPLNRSLVTPSGFAAIASAVRSEGHDENAQVRAVAIRGLG